MPRGTPVDHVDSKVRPACIGGVTLDACPVIVLRRDTVGVRYKRHVTGGVAVAGTLWVLLTMLSRLPLHVHRFFDVLRGALLGGAVALSAILVLEAIEQRGDGCARWRFRKWLNRRP